MSLTEPESNWEESYKAIQARVHGAIPAPCHMIYSAYEQTSEGVPIDNLDRLAMEGKVCFVDDNGEEPYRSSVVENPTWLTVARLANEMILATGDLHHVFLESINQKEEVEGIKIMEFFMGS
jgi:hypothetical protein